MNFTEYQKEVTAEIARTLSGISETETQGMTQLICDAKRVFLAGAGRSGFMVRGFAMRLMHMGICAYLVGEVVTPAICEGDLLIIASGSGETASLVSMAKKAKAIGAKVALVTIFLQSSIGVQADLVVQIPAPTPKSDLDSGVSSVQPMGSLFEQSLLLTLDILIMMLMEKLGKTEKEMFARHANLE